ncbi:protein tyrosine phosphatase [Mycobacterium neglectum]|uniref:arsenate reductase/protein-tyrosine-phosphatase family protein n=1 Tax=Mycobacterium neglectum TaxID=242737 RepID=UPI000BFED6E0|nr:protein tyrosine phosphatase [Mycobacterium neglectum]
MPLHITFICSGNICRSPMAEIMFAQQIAARGLADAVHINSAGTFAWRKSRGLDPRATPVLRQHGYPAPSHRTSQLTAAHLRADLLVCAGRKHLAHLADYGGVPGERLALLRAFDPKWAGRPDVPDVADPYYNGEFAATFAAIDAALPGLHEWVDQQLARAGRAHVGAVERGRTAAQAISAGRNASGR